MTSWASVALSEVADVMAGQPAPQESEVFGKRGLPFIRAGHLSGLQQSSYPDQRIDKDLGASLGLKCVADGSVLFAKSGMSATKGIVVTLECDAYLVSHVCGITPSDELDSRFLMYWLRWQPPSHLIRDLAYPSIRLEDVRALRIPLPPLPEQRRIAAILDKADGICRKRRQTLDLADQFLRSAFLDLFGDPVTNPKGWPSGGILDVVADPKEDIRCGPFGTQLKASEIVRKGVPLLGIENVKGGHFRPSRDKFLSQEKAEALSRFDARSGDILMTRMGTIGHACVVPPTVIEARITYHLFRIRVDSAKCLPEFLAASIARSGTFMSQLERMAHGAIMSGLKTDDLKQVRFLIPPPGLQKKYVQIIRRVDELTQRGERLVVTTRELSDSLVQRAFQGSLQT